MKKTFALLVALMLLVAMLPGTAMAYTAPDMTTTQFNHKLELTYAANDFDDENIVIAYKYTVGSAMKLTQTGTDDDDDPIFTSSSASSYAVDGTPVITGNNNNYVVFDKDSIFSNKESSVTVTVDWSNVEITEPGFYIWEMTKSFDAAASALPTASPSTDSETFYLYALVTRSNNDTLAATYGISTDANLKSKGGNVDDQYPAKKVTLEIEKQISGNLASANQYFPFDIVITSTPGLSFTIEGLDDSVPENTYNSEVAAIEDTIAIEANGEGRAQIWLRAGQTAMIKDLPYGSSYTIIEGGNSGFDVSAIITGDDTPDLTNVGNDKTVMDTSLTSDTTVTYTNTKNATIPTGVILNTAAPVMGILLALSLLAVLYIGKRKAYQA